MRDSWIDEPEGMLLCEHDLVVALGLRTVFFQAVQTLLEGVADLRFFEIRPFIGRSVETALVCGSQETIIEEVAAFLTGEEIGLVVNVEDLEEEVGGCAGNADKEEALGFILRGICSSDGHGDKDGILF